MENKSLPPNLTLTGGLERREVDVSHTTRPDEHVSQNLNTKVLSKRKVASVSPLF
jgi:hypothetical protein